MMDVRQSEDGVAEGAVDPILDAAGARPLMGRRVVVTGGSKGLGREIVEALLARGAHVAVLARKGAALDAMMEQNSPVVHPCPCDVRSPQSVREAIAQSANAMGGIDTLINNAAMCCIGRLDAAEEDTVRAEIETNLMGPIWTVREVVPHLRGSPMAQIINVTSEAVLQSPAYLGVYAATKVALESLSLTMKRELREDGIRVTALRVGRMSGSALQTSWNSEIRRAFYEQVRSSGIDVDSGQAMAPKSVALALMGHLELPLDVISDLIVLRGR